jgi:hypothetical protein
MKYAVIADVAGQYEPLLRLIKRIPEGYEPIFLGDLCDRGPDSDLVFEFVINNNYKCVLANHESMFFDAYRNHKSFGMYGGSRAIYEWGVWVGNGGHTTLRNYTQVPANPDSARSARLLEKHLDWINNLPYRLDLPVDMEGFDTIMCTHAPLHAQYEDDHKTEHSELHNWVKLNNSVLWNRSPPVRRKAFQLNGHNSHWGLQVYDDEQGIYGWCLDDSKRRVLTAMLIPEQVVIQEPYEEVIND